MLDHKLYKCAPDDPRRCQATIKNGQCPFVSVEGWDTCQIHSAPGKAIAQSNNNIRSYRVAKWNSRLRDLVDSPTLKTLREEIAVARLTLEAILLKCDDATDLLIYSSKIAQQLSIIKDLVIACNRLEDRLGFTLDRSEIITIASQIANLVANFLPQEKADEFADQIYDLLDAKSTPNQLILEASSRES